MKQTMSCLLLALVIGSALLVVAQTTDKEIDFMALPQDLKFLFNHNEVVRLKIINLNRFLHKVTSEKTETDFHMTVPAVLSGITLPAFVNTAVPGAGDPAPMEKDENCYADTGVVGE